jgi:hypothetical protein
MFPPIDGFFCTPSFGTLSIHFDAPHYVHVSHCSFGVMGGGLARMVAVFAYTLS